MNTEMMIRELKRVEEVHKNDRVFTGDLDIASMAHDVRKRLQFFKPYEDTGLTPDEINALRERDAEKVPEKFIIDSETKIGAIRFGKGTKIYRCPECGKMLVYQDHYCRNCGQRLKWEE